MISPSDDGALGKCDQCMNMIFDFICGIRAGINPAPTVAECCNHFYNPLIAKVLHTSAVGAGFIPALPTADKIQSKYLQQHRARIDDIVVVTTIQSLYFMRYAQFYALAIFFMYRL